MYIYIYISASGENGDVKSEKRSADTGVKRETRTHRCSAGLFYNTTICMNYPGVCMCVCVCVFYGCLRGTYPRVCTNTVRRWEEQYRKNEKKRRKKFVKKYLKNTERSEKKAKREKIENAKDSRKHLRRLLLQLIRKADIFVIFHDVALFSLVFFCAPFYYR